MAMSPMPIEPIPEAARAPQVIPGRPIKIDPADGPCPYCEQWAIQKERVIDGVKVRCCDDCGNPIPVYPNMGGNGYDAQTTHHYHLGQITSQAPPTWLHIPRELCLECYRVDYQKAFPGHPDPV